jgi:hypothetical protein
MRGDRTRIVYAWGILKNPWKAQERLGLKVAGENHKLSIVNLVQLENWSRESTSSTLGAGIKE